MKKKRVVKLLLALIIIANIVALVIAGGFLPALWEGIKNSLKILFPHWWMIFVYADVGLFAYLLGRMASIKNAAEND